MRRITLVAILAVAACTSGVTDITATTVTGEELSIADDFLLLDVNPASATNGTYVSPRTFMGGASAYYFGDARSPYCADQFGQLDKMQKELDGTPVALLGINLHSAGPGNRDICEGNNLPWLQDTTFEGVWHAWKAAHRDLVILDTDNWPVAVFNLKDFDLANPANYAEVKAAIEAAVR